MTSDRLFDRMGDVMDWPIDMVMHAPWRWLRVAGVVPAMIVWLPVWLLVLFFGTIAVIALEIWEEAA